MSAILKEQADFATQAGHYYRNGYAISFDGNEHGWERVGGPEVDA